MTEESVKKTNHWLAPAIVLGIMLAAYFAIRIVGATGSVSEIEVVDPVTVSIKEMEKIGEEAAAKKQEAVMQKEVAETKIVIEEEKIACALNHSKRLITREETEAIACEPQIPADTERFTEAQQ